MEIIANITGYDRVKDDCNNWTRSEDLAFDANPKVHITSPVDESEHEYGEPVIFNAHIQDIPPVLAGLGDYIKWSVRKAGSTNWYGPYEPEPYNYWENHFDSELPFHPDDWTGATFEIIEFKDCEGLDVQARLDVCSITEDMVTIYVEGTRSGQQWSNHGIYLFIQPGVLNSNRYLIDGPSIPWTANNDWYTGKLMDYRLTTPALGNLNIGKIRIRVCIDEISHPCVWLISKYRVEAYNMDYQTTELIAEVPRSVFAGEDQKYCKVGSWIEWDMTIPPGRLCGDYKIKATGYYDNDEPACYTESDVIYLDMVHKSDMARLCDAGVMDGIPYGGGSGKLVCDQFVHQVMLLLGRREAVNGDWPPAFVGAGNWRPANNANHNRIEAIGFSELQPGDLIVWGAYPDEGATDPPRHVGIFAGWVSGRRHRPNDGMFRAYIWETTESGKVPKKNEVQIGTSRQNRVTTSTGDKWHIATRWRTDHQINIFNACP